MAVFFVVAIKDPNAIAPLVADLGEGSSLAIRLGVWLVDYEGTTQSLAEKLKIRGDDFVSTGLVAPISNYSGRASQDTWEWLAKRMPARAG